MIAFMARTSQHPLAEITLRKYERPYQLEERELVKRVCLSLGLLQPGDSRDVVVDILQIMLHQKQPIDSPTIEKLVIENRKKYKCTLLGCATSNIRRQVRRIRELFLIEKMKKTYRITENERFSQIFEDKIRKISLDPMIERIKEYLNALDSLR